MARRLTRDEKRYAIRAKEFYSDVFNEDFIEEMINACVIMDHRIHMADGDDLGDMADAFEIMDEDDIEEVRESIIKSWKIVLGIDLG